MAKVKGFPDPIKLTSAERVYMALDRQFGDPETSAKLIGLEAGIGPRRVKGILEEKGTCLRLELLKRRMARAEELLVKTDYAVCNVARLCGYRCQSTFAKRFAEQHDKQSPRSYRVGHGGSRRAGGTTGAFRKAAQRARARQRGEIPPSMSPWRTLPGHDQVVLAEWENQRRRAALRGESPARTQPPRLGSPDRSDPYLDAYMDGYLDHVLDWELEQ